MRARSATGLSPIVLPPLAIRLSDAALRATSLPCAGCRRLPDLCKGRHVGRAWGRGASARAEARASGSSTGARRGRRAHLGTALVRSNASADNTFRNRHCTSRPNLGEKCSGGFRQRSLILLSRNEAETVCSAGCACSVPNRRCALDCPCKHEDRAQQPNASRGLQASTMEG